MCGKFWKGIHLYLLMWRVRFGQYNCRETTGRESKVAHENQFLSECLFCPFSHMIFDCATSAVMQLNKISNISVFLSAYISVQGKHAMGFAHIPAHFLFSIITKKTLPQSYEFLGDVHSAAAGWQRDMQPHLEWTFSNGMFDNTNTHHGSSQNKHHTARGGSTASIVRDETG